MTSSHHFYDTTPTVFDMVSTVSVSSHPLYWLYHNTQFWDLIRYIWWHHIHFIWHQSHWMRVITLSFKDRTPFVCRTSNPLYVKYHTLYKAPHPHKMISHHIIYEITCTVFITLNSLYLKWPLPYLCHHNESIDGLRPTVCMTLHPLYVPSFEIYTILHPLFMTSHHCSYHITSTAFMTSHTLYMTSHTWQ